jgi:uncharacterized protein (DUF2336 family)
MNAFVEGAKALRAIAARLKDDPRVARVLTESGNTMSSDSTSALLAVVPRHGPRSAEGVSFVRSLRADP